MNLNNCLLKNFTSLNYNEKILILKWRNYDNIRHWMYNSNNIPTITHLNFIENLKRNLTSKYFLVSKNKQDIGVVYFNNINKKECEFGLYANPFEKVIGVGRILEEISITYAFEILKVNKLKLEVFSDNAQVVNLHKKYKFKESDRKVVNNKEVICMELEYENR